MLQAASPERRTPCALAGWLCAKSRLSTVAQSKDYERQAQKNVPASQASSSKIGILASHLQSSLSTGTTRSCSPCTTGSKNSCCSQDLNTHLSRKSAHSGASQSVSIIVTLIDVLVPARTCNNAQTCLCFYHTFRTSMPLCI
eukprot:2428435-Amphidinium_carterae.2